MTFATCFNLLNKPLKFGQLCSYKIEECDKQMNLCEAVELQRYRDVLAIVTISETLAWQDILLKVTYLFLDTEVL